MHVPTGLYVAGGWAEWTDNNRRKITGLSTYNVDDTDDFWYVQVGWQAKLNSLGNTIFWGQYMEKNDGLNVNGGAPSSVTGGQANTLTSTDSAQFVRRHRVHRRRQVGDLGRRHHPEH